MAFALSPSVNVKEIDLTTSIPAVSTSIAGFAGRFQWGPAYMKKLITTEKDLISVFGYPDDNTYEDWFTAWNFLQYGNTLYVVRAVDPTTAKNAGLECNDTTGATAPASYPTYLTNSDAVDAYTYGATTTADKLLLTAKYPGLQGNTYKVAVSNFADWATAEIVDGVLFADEFEFAPASTEEFGYVVLDSADQILEQAIVSFTPGAKNFEGTAIYVEDYINRYSAYINAFANDQDTDEILSFEGTLLAGGVEGAPTVGNVVIAYDEFANAEEFDINLILDGANNDIATQAAIISMCEDRMDAMAILCVPRVDVVNIAAGTATTNCAAYRATISSASSYAALYANWKYQYDKFNDKYRWVPMSGDAAGIYAYTDDTRDPWFAPAGLNRGKIRNTIKLAFSPNRAQRDTMYKVQCNSCVEFAGDGATVFGQKTMQNKPSAFDRVDVRRLFMILEKAISTASKYFVFEKNTAFTRRQIIGMIEPFLRNVQGREGINEFLVVCDETNNTPVVIDRNELVCDIFIQPTRTAEFISLNFIATRTGVDFSEYIGKSF
jgi:phage tail sheath protein FI